jgi:hypothetical protein
LHGRTITESFSLDACQFEGARLGAVTLAAPSQAIIFEATIFGPAGSETRFGRDLPISFCVEWLMESRSKASQVSSVFITPEGDAGDGHPGKR